MTDEQKPTSDIVAELRKMGQQIGTAAKALWESDDSRSVRQEIREGLAEAGRQIDTAVRSFQESDAGHKIGTQVRQTVDKARDSDAAGKVEQGIVATLREVNRQLERTIGSWTSQPTEPTPPPPPPPPPSEPEGSA
jgi:hypothetical protein